MRECLLRSNPLNFCTELLTEAVDAVLAYTRPRSQFGFTVQNLLNVAWNEAQYATKTQLRGEPAPITERTFTPGTPFNLRVNASIFF